MQNSLFSRRLFPAAANYYESGLKQEANLMAVHQPDPAIQFKDDADSAG